MRAFWYRLAILAGSVAFAWVAAGCGALDDDSGGPVPLVAYLAELDAPGVVELYVSGADGSHPRKVSGPSMPDVDVISFGWSPDKTLLWFLADRETNDTWELYVVRADGSDAPRNVSGVGPDAAIGNVNHAMAIFPGGEFPGSGPAFSFDSTKIAYLADTNTFDYALYAADLTAFAVEPKRLSPAGPVAECGVKTFSWSPDDQRIAYAADLVLDEQFELFTVAPDGTGHVQVSQPGVAVTTDDVAGYFWSRDAARLAFVHNPAGNASRRLYTCLPDGAGLVERSAIPDATRSVENFRWAPDGSALAYVADQDTDELSELFVTDPVAGAPWKVGAAPADHEIGIVPTWSPDSTKIAFNAVNAAQNTGELRVVAAAGGVPAIVGGPYPPGDYAETFGVRWSPDSQRIAFTVTQNTPYFVDLHLAPADGSTETVIGPVFAGEFVDQYAWSPDGRRIAYTRYENPNGPNLYVVDPDGGTPVQVSDVPYVVNQTAAVYRWDWAGSRHVVYIGGAPVPPASPPPNRLWVGVVQGDDVVSFDITDEPTGLGHVWDEEVGH